MQQQLPPWANLPKINLLKKQLKNKQSLNQSLDQCAEHLARDPRIHHRKLALSAPLVMFLEASTTWGFPINPNIPLTQLVWTPHPLSRTTYRRPELTLHSLFAVGYRPFYSVSLPSTTYTAPIRLSLPPSKTISISECTLNLFFRVFSA